MISSVRARLSAGIERERSATITTSTPLPPSGASGTAAISATTISIRTRTYPPIEEARPRQKYRNSSGTIRSRSSG
jgi:hypothetical protein